MTIEKTGLGLGHGREAPGEAEMNPTMKSGCHPERERGIWLGGWREEVHQNALAAKLPLLFVGPGRTSESECSATKEHVIPSVSEGSGWAGGTKKYLEAEDAAKLILKFMRVDFLSR